MNNQVVYVKPNAQGFCSTFSYDSKYQNVDGWYSAVIDHAHLYGFNIMPYTVRYDFDQGILRYPDNWKPSQSARIENLNNQISSINYANNNLENELTKSNQQLANVNKDNTDLKNQLAKSVANDNNLEMVVLGLQKQLSSIQSAKAPTDTSSAKKSNNDDSKANGKDNK